MHGLVHAFAPILRPVLGPTHCSFQVVGWLAASRPKNPDCHSVLLSSSLWPVTTDERVQMSNHYKRIYGAISDRLAGRRGESISRPYQAAAAAAAARIRTRRDEVRAIWRRKRGSGSPWQQMPRRLTAALAADAEPASNHAPRICPPPRTPVSPPENYQISAPLASTVSGLEL